MKNKFLTVFAFISITLLATPFVWADTPIFLTPYKTDKKSTKRDENGKSKRKRPIFLTPQKDLSRSRSAQILARKPSKPVYRNDLSIYKELKGLDLTKLSSAGDNPENADELRKVAAAHRIPLVKETLKLQKELDRPTITPVIQSALLKPLPLRHEVASEPRYALSAKGTRSKSTQKKNVKYIYKPAKKKKIIPWKVFGN